MFADGKISERVKWGLFDLISNVLFFEVEGTDRTQFYPRYGMESLRTFQDLDDYTKVNYANCMSTISIAVRMLIGISRAWRNCRR